MIRCSTTEQAAVTLAEAARELGRSEATLRRWVREGAPTARLGGPGRSHGSLVVLADLERWRARERTRKADFVELLGRLLADYHRAGDHRLVGLRDAPARLLYAALLEYIAGRLEDADL